MIPFDTYNLFYREPEQRARLQAIRNKLGSPQQERRALPVV